MNIGFLIISIALSAVSVQAVDETVFSNNKRENVLCSLIESVGSIHAMCPTITNRVICEALIRARKNRMEVTVLVNKEAREGEESRQLLQDLADNRVDVFSVGEKKIDQSVMLFQGCTIGGRVRVVRTAQGSVEPRSTHVSKLTVSSRGITYDEYKALFDSLKQNGTKIEPDYVIPSSKL